MEIADREQLGLARVEPGPGGGALAFWAMAIAAGVIGDHRVVAVLTARHVTAECRGAAALDGVHHLELAEAHMAGIRGTPGSAMVAEDIRDLQS